MPSSRRDADPAEIATNCSSLAGNVRPMLDLPASAAIPNFPIAQPHSPKTFSERGVSVPFTTPVLAGSRVRPARRGGFELITPNPGGGRGAYVLPWSGVRELCRPTDHDIRLNELMGALSDLTPASIRQAALMAATEGFAGRGACTAANAASVQDRKDRVLTNFLLLLELMTQVTPSSRASGGDILNMELQTRARNAVVRIAPSVGLRPEAIAAGLEELAGVFVGIGLPTQSPPSRLSRLLDTLQHMSTETAAWSVHHGDDSSEHAAMLSAVAGLTIECARTTMIEAHGLAGDVRTLLREWRLAPSLLAQRIARTEWLLDGWEQICLLWQSGETEAGKRGALVEMAVLVPTLPQEVCDWVGGPIDIDLVQRFRRAVPLNVDWRTGAVFDRTARNERLRALAA